MTPILLNPPSVEPISLAQAKAWLRVTGADEDDLIAGLVVAARTLVETVTRTALLAQTWRVVLDAWPADGLRVPLAPFRSVVALRTLAADGAEQIVPASSYVVDASPAEARVRFLVAPAQPGRSVAGAEMDLVVGFAAAPEEVPEPLRHAVRLLLARWYEQRGDAGTDSAAERLPGAVAALLAPYRRVRLS
ncbi:MAG: hypothetical protein JWN93_258 [Hyphomicrobiales bacterium]|nr:hypothetical protein [Hyphomicrobiales bacterium]